MGSKVVGKQQPDICQLATNFLATLRKVPERPTEDQIALTVDRIANSTVGIDICLSYDQANYRTRIDTFGIANTLRGTRILSIPRPAGMAKKTIHELLTKAVDANWDLYVLELANRLTDLSGYDRDSKDVVDTAHAYAKAFARSTHVISAEADQRYLDVAKLHADVNVDLDKLHGFS